LARAGRLPVTPLAVPRDRAPQPWPAGRLAHDSVSRAVFTQLRARAKAHGVTFNDYLLATLFRTLTVWNERHGDPRPSDRMRVMMPTSTRDQRHADMPSANCIGFAIIDRSPGECAQRDALLSGMARSTVAVRERRMGVAFVDILAFDQAIARARGKWLRRKRTRRSSRCVTTAILSYLGDIERYLPQGGPRDEDGSYVFGDVALLTQLGHPPRQDLTRIALSIHYYRNELILNINADAKCFDYAQALDFLSLYKATLIEATAPEQTFTQEAPALAGE
jgi:hypothetical protein